MINNDGHNTLRLSIRLQKVIKACGEIGLQEECWFENLRILKYSTFSAFAVANAYRLYWQGPSVARSWSEKKATVQRLKARNIARHAPRWKPCSNAFLVGRKWRPESHKAGSPVYLSKEAGGRAVTVYLLELLPVKRAVIAISCGRSIGRLGGPQFVLIGLHVGMSAAFSV